MNSQSVISDTAARRPHNSDSKTAALEEARRATFRTAVEQIDDYVVATNNPANVEYISGYRSLQALAFRRPVYLLASPTKTVLVCTGADVPAVLGHGADVDVVVSYSEFHYSGVEPLEDLEIIRRRGLNAALGTALAEVGLHIEVSCLGEAMIEGEATFDAKGRVTSTTSIRQARSIKSPPEIDALRNSATLVEHALSVGLEWVRPGVTERAVAAAIDSAIASGGGSPACSVVTTGIRTALVDTVPTETQIRHGDTVRIDVSGHLNGYWFDMARTVIVGTPSARQRQVYEALRAGLTEEMEGLAPGVPAKSLFHRTVDCVRASGIPSYRRNHCGHGLGLEPYDAPSISGGEAGELAAGMVLACETPFYDLSWGGMMIEDMFLVTDTGYERLSTLSWDLDSLSSQLGGKGM